jgi:PAS domain S-box-containing protein
MNTGKDKLNMVDEDLEKYLFLNNSIPMAITDLDFRVVKVNKMALDLLGYDENEFIGKFVYDINATGTIAFDIEKAKKLINGEINSYIISRKYITKDNDRVEGALLVSRIDSENGNQYYSGIFIDDETLKSKEDIVISQRYEMLSTVLATSPDIQYIMDVERKQYIYQNIDFFNFLGYTDDDLQGKTKWEFLKEKQEEDSIVVFSKGKKYLSDITQVGDFTDIEYKIYCKDGSFKWLRERSTPIVISLEGEIQYCFTIIQDVSDKREIFEKVVEQQLFIEKIASFTPDVIFVFDINTLDNLYNNLRYRKFLGYSSTQWLQPNLSGVTERRKKLIIKHFARLEDINDEDVISEEFQFIDNQSRKYWLLVKSKVFKRDANGKPTQALSLASDITEYKNAILRVENAEKTQRSVFEAIPDLIIKVNKAGDYLEIKENKLEDGYQVKAENLVGKSLYETLPEDIFQLVKSELELAFELNTIRIFEFERTLNDKIHYLENHISPINENEAIIIVRNITHKKKMQQAVEEKVLELSGKNIELEKYITKNKELERFAYIVSHDLKEPLRTINAFSEIIKNNYSEDLDEDAKMYFDFIISSVHRMTNLVEGILEYSKIEVNETAFETTDLNDIIRKVVNDLSVVIEEKNAVIEFENLPSLFCDSLQIRQLFQNLISNGIKFSAAGKTPHIKIEYQENPDYFQFSVEDNGIGVPKHFQESVFSMFKRLHPREKYIGQGIGLSLCKRIVERHGGEIWIDSDGKTYTKVLFSIPVSQ